MTGATHKHRSVCKGIRCDSVDETREKRCGTRERGPRDDVMERGMSEVEGRREERGHSVSAVHNGDGLQGRIQTDGDKATR